MKHKRWRLLAVCLCLFCSCLFSWALPAAAAPTLTTTLTDNAVQRGSKKTFDVWARNGAGNKIRATVQLNGQTVAPTWEDEEKSSYTLVFTREGANTVTVSASADGGKKTTLTYHITYRKAQPGEKIGTAVWSVELFTVGCGYLIPPVEVPIYEGETAAEQLVRLLHDNGLVGYYGGEVKQSFYLAYVADGTAAGERYNGYRKSGTPRDPRPLGITPSIPAVLTPYLQAQMNYFDPEDYASRSVGYLGEFVFTNGSGWMYSVNHVFPNVGFADAYPADGDTVRVQFTLGYGADIGGAGVMGSGVTDAYFSVANKDALTRQIAAARQSGRLTEAAVKRTYEAALTAAYTLDASQTAVDAAETALRQALAAAPAVPSVSAPAGTTAAENSAAAPTTTAPSGSSLPAEAALGADPASEPEESSGLTEHADTAQPAERSSGGVVVVCAVMGVVLIGTAGMIVYWKYKRRAAGKGTETDA